MINYAMLISLSSIQCAEDAKDTPKISDPALSAYEKAIADIDAKALIEKRKARDVAVKALDKRLQELSKAGKLDSAIALKGERDKLAELWKGSDGDLLGDVGGFKSGKDVILHLTKNPKWKSASGKILTIDARQMRAQWIEGGKVIYNAEVVVEKSVIRWGNCKIDFAKSDGKMVEFIWPAGEMEILTVVDSE